MQTKLAAVQERGEIATVDSILEAVGADRWTKEQIEAHKAAEIAKAPPPHRLHKWIPVFQGIFTVIGLGALGVAFLSFAGLVACIIAAYFDVQNAVTGMIVCASTFLGSATLFATIMWLVFADIRLRAPARWVKEYPFDEDMPKRAHQLVRDIGALAPGSTFMLHVLRQGSTMLDPILEATIKNPQTGKRETHAVLVWDGEGNIIAPH